MINMVLYKVLFISILSINRFDTAGFFFFIISTDLFICQYFHISVHLVEKAVFFKASSMYLLHQNHTGWHLKRSPGKP